MSEPALLGLFLLVRRGDKLAASIHHLLCVRFVGAFVSIYDFQQVELMVVFATCVPQEVCYVEVSVLLVRLERAIEEIVLRNY